MYQKWKELTVAYFTVLVLTAHTDSTGKTNFLNWFKEIVCRILTFLADHVVLWNFNNKGINKSKGKQELLRILTMGLPIYTDVCQHCILSQALSQVLTECWLTKSKTIVLMQTWPYNMLNTGCKISCQCESKSTVFILVLPIYIDVCYSTVYSVLSRVLWIKPQALLLGWDSNPRPLQF